MASNSVVFQILQHGQVHKPRNPEQIFDLHNQEFCMRVLNTNTSVFLVLGFGEISPFEVLNLHKFHNKFYIYTEKQNTNIILSI
jgi:hypothetical protein